MNSTGRHGIHPPRTIRPETPAHWLAKLWPWGRGRVRGGGGRSAPTARTPTGEAKGRAETPQAASEEAKPLRVALPHRPTPLLTAKEPSEPSPNVPQELSAETQAVERRATAARELITAGQVDPELALSYTVWPSLKLNTASQRGPRPSRERVNDAVDLVAQGIGQAKAAERFGVGRFPIQEHLRDSDLQMRLRV